MRPEVIEFAKGLPVRAFVWNVTQYPYHWHSAPEIIYVLQGRVKVVISGEDHMLEENNVAVINEGELHRISKISDTNRLLILQIDPSFCADVHSGYREALFYCCSTYHEVQAPEKYDMLKENIARLVYYLCTDPGKNQKKNVKNCLLEMLSHLIDSFDYLRFGPGVKAFRDKQTLRFKRIYFHIQRSSTEKLSLLELARASGVSLQHLSYDIRDKFGYTFQELVHYSRCEQAARLLLSTNKMIYEIAPECGFSDPKYLIKSFKMFYHCTPSEFRRIHWAETDMLASQARFREFPLSCVLGTEKFKKYFKILKSSMSDIKEENTIDSAI